MQIPVFLLVSRARVSALIADSGPYSSGGNCVTHRLQTCAMLVPGSEGGHST